MSLGRSPHQCGLSKFGFARVGVSPTGQQHGHRFHPVTVGCTHQGSLPRQQSRIGIRSRIQQQFDELRIGIHCRLVKRRRAQGIDTVSICATCEESPCHFDIVGMRRPEQRSGAIAGCDIRICTFIQKRNNRCTVALFGSSNQGRRVWRGSNACAHNERDSTASGKNLKAKIL